MNSDLLLAERLLRITTDKIETMRATRSLQTEYRYTIMKNMYEATFSLYESLYKANGEILVNHQPCHPEAVIDTDIIPTSDSAADAAVAAQAQVDEVMQGLDDLFYDDVQLLSLPISSQERYMNELLLASIAELEPVSTISSDFSVESETPYLETVSPLLFMVPSMAPSVKVTSSVKRKSWWLSTRLVSPPSTKSSSKLLSFHQWLSKWSQFRKRATVCNV